MTNTIRRKNQSDNLKLVPLDDYSNYLYSFDLGAATSLVTAGFELVSLEKSNKRKAQFIFRRESGIEKTLEDYWANHLEVKARSFFENTKMIKARLYSD